LPRKTPLVIALDGAPLAFSTHYAHDMTLSVAGKDGKVDRSGRAGGCAARRLCRGYPALATAALSDTTRGSLHGYWGFEKYDGPIVQLGNASAQKWELNSNDQGALIVGREDTVHLQAASNSCVAERDAPGPGRQGTEGGLEAGGRGLDGG
jgi:hypothetical protein